MGSRGVTPWGEEEEMLPLDRVQKLEWEVRKQQGQAAVGEAVAASFKADPTVPRNHLPYLGQWAVAYLEYCGLEGRDRKADRSRLDFLAELARQGRKGFVLKQADQAVRKVQEVVQDKEGLPGGKLSDAGRTPGLGSSGTDTGGGGARWRMGSEGWAEVKVRMEREVRLRHYSRKTLKTYLFWTSSFGRFLGGKDPAGVDSEDARAFLEHLARDRKIAASTQNQAFNALLFLYGTVLGSDLSEMEAAPRAKRGMDVPVVLSREEVARLLGALRPPYDLFFRLVYGCGLRLGEALGLRVQDLDFGNGALVVHRGKGGKSRKLPLPVKLVPALREHLEMVKGTFREDAAESAGVILPEGLERKYPRAARDWPWYWVFPGRERTWLPEGRVFRRNHLHETLVQKAIKQAVDETGIPKRASAHTLRHSYATHVLLMGTDIRTLQELLGHSDLKTTMIYTQAARLLSGKVTSPLDAL